MLLGAALQMFCHRLSLLELQKKKKKKKILLKLLAVSALCCFSIQLNQVLLHLCDHTVSVWFPSDLLLLACVAFSLQLVQSSGNMSISTAAPPDKLVAVFIITGAGRPSSFCRQAQASCKYVFKNAGTCRDIGAAGVKYHTKYLSALSVSKHIF